MSIDDQLDIIQNDIINYLNYTRLLTYAILIMIKKLIFGFWEYYIYHWQPLF